MGRGILGKDRRGIYEVLRFDLVRCVFAPIDYDEESEEDN